VTAIIRLVMIRGRVQGVGYRVWLAQTAESYGLEGWVRNRRDGSVEALFAGAEATVADMIAKCQHGPSASRVDAVVVEEAGADMLAQRGADERFSILPTV